MWFLLLVLFAVDMLIFILNGFVLLNLYKWFNVFGLPDITLPAAIGFVLIGSILSSSGIYKKQNPEEIFTQYIMKLISPLIFLIMGYIFSFYI